MAIWVGKYMDTKGEFEILVSAVGRDKATQKIRESLNNIIRNPNKVVLGDRIVGVPELLYIEEVGEFDLVRQ